MKKTVSLLLALALCLAMFGCNKKEPQANAPHNGDRPGIPSDCKVGDTATTDHIAFTLDQAELTLACRYFTTAEFTAKNFDNYLTPIAYDQVTPLVATDEETLIAFTFTVKNLKAESQNYRGGDWYVIYKGEKYPLTQQSQKNITLSQAAIRQENGKWEYNGPINTFLDGGKSYSFRTYGILPLRTDSMSDTFELHIPLASSSAEPVEVVYTINP